MNKIIKFTDEQIQEKLNHLKDKLKLIPDDIQIHFTKKDPNITEIIQVKDKFDITMHYTLNESDEYELKRMRLYRYQKRKRNFFYKKQDILDHIELVMKLIK